MEGLEAPLVAAPASQPFRERIRQFNARFKQTEAEIDVVENEYRKERLALELKYQQALGSSLNKRAEAVAPGSEAAGAGDKKYTQEFWCKVLKNVKSVAEHVHEEDYEALKYLKDIKVNYFDSLDNIGYDIHFIFEENPFFDNKELIKTVRNARLFAPGDRGLGSLSGTDIKWKSDDKNLNKIPDSFFHFFDNSTTPGSNASSISASSNGEHQQSKHERLNIQRDLKIAEAIREKVQYRAIDYFTGDLVDLDGDDDEDDNDNDNDDDDDDE